MRKLLFIILLISTQSYGQFKYTIIKGTVFDMDSYMVISKDPKLTVNFILSIDSSYGVTEEDFINRGMVVTAPYLPPILWIPSPPSSIEDYSILSHEILHLVSYLLKWAGVPLSDDTEEVYGYMMQYYTKEIYTRLEYDKRINSNK